MFRFTVYVLVVLATIAAAVICLWFAPLQLVSVHNVYRTLSEGNKSSKPNMELPLPVANAPDSVPSGISLNPEDRAAAPGGPPYVDLHGRRTYDGYIPTISPSLSPDCRQLVFMDPTEGNGDIFLLDLDTNARQRLVGGPNVEREPRFTHDGSGVLFLREVGAFRHVYIVDLASKDVSQLTSGNTVDDLVELAPTGDRALVLRRPIVPGWENAPWIPLYELDLEHRTEVDLQIKAGGRYTGGGRLVAYNDHKDLDSIWVLDRATGLRRRVGTGMVAGGHPTRSEVLVSRPASSYFVDGDIALLDLDTGKQQPLGQACAGMFLPNERLLGWSDGGNGLFVRDLATGRVRSATTPRGILAPACEPPQYGKLPLWIQYPNGEQVFMIGVLDIESLKFEEKLRLDMRALRVSPDDAAVGPPKGKHVPANKDGGSLSD